MVIIQLACCATYAYSCNDLAASGEDRCRQAAHAGCVLFVINRVTSLACCCQLFQQTRQIHDGPRRCSANAVLRDNLLHVMRIEMTNECLANCSNLRCYALPDPNVHLDETGRLDSLDVNGVAVIEDSKVRAKPRSFHGATQVRNCDLAQRHSLHRLSPET